MRPSLADGISGSAGDARSVLLLADNDPAHAATVTDHIDALRHLSRHQVRLFNPVALKKTGLDLDEFDAVVIHYSLPCITPYFLPTELVDKLAAYRGLKVQFIQDEYRYIDAMTSVMRKIRLDVLFSVMPAAEIERIYGPRLPGVRFEQTLTGFVSDSLVGREVPPLAKRSIEIGYRGRSLPYWLGRLAYEKRLIGEGVLARADRYGLRCDISARECDRIYGEAWLVFISSCRATLATGSGASIADFDGEVERRVREYLKEFPEAPFEEVEEAILQQYEGNLKLEVLSPRLFEAAALRTALIMFPGPYSGLLRPWEHYLPLARDFSNMPRVVGLLRNDHFVTEMTDRAYRDLIGSGRWSFREFARHFDKVIDSAKAPAHRWPVKYRLALLQRHTEPAIASKPVKAALQKVASSSGSRLLARFAEDPRAYTATGAVALARVMARRSYRRLLFANLTDAASRKRVPTDRLLEELLDISVLTDVQAGRQVVGEPFRLAVSVATDKPEVTLLSMPGQQAQPGVPVEAVRTAILPGSAVSIVWDHRHLGGAAYHRLTQNWWLTIAAGTDGRTRFDALGGMTVRHPELVLDVLAGVLTATPVTMATPPPPVRRRPPRIPPRALHGMRLVVVTKRALENKAYRRVLLAFGASRSLRAEVDNRRLLEELFMISVLTDVQNCRQSAGEPYRLAITLDSRTRKLVLTSYPGPNPHKTISHEQLKAALSSGGFEAITWDHSPRGGVAYHKLTRQRWMRVSHDEGKTRFEALAAISRHKPDLVLPVLTPLLRPQTTPRVARRHAGLQRLLSDPFGYTARGRLAMSVALAEPRLRGLLLRGLGDPRMWPRLDAFLEDLLKLGLVHRIAAGEIRSLDGSVAHVEMRIDANGNIRLVTRRGIPPKRSANVIGKGRIDSVTWDHSQLGASVDVPFGKSAITVHLSPPGSHRFRTLTSLPRMERLLTTLLPYIAASESDANAS